LRKGFKQSTTSGRIKCIFANARVSPAVGPPTRRSVFLLLLASVLVIPVLLEVAVAQTGGGFTIYGDLKVDESKVSGLKPMSFQVTLQSQKLSVIGRQTVPKNGRFRFENLSGGTYYIVVMMENQRSRLIWKLFMSNPEIKPALDRVGFQPDF